MMIILRNQLLAEGASNAAADCIGAVANASSEKLMAKMVLSVGQIKDIEQSSR